MSDPVRVAVVGAGSMGADHVRRLHQRINGATVSAVVEPDRDRAASVAAMAPGAAVYSRVQEALDAGVADAVLVATPGQHHAAVLLPALDAGLAILCEKPLTQDSASSWQILEREQRLDRPHIQVGFLRRFDAEYQQLRAIVATGELGDLLMIHAAHRNPAAPHWYTQDRLINDSVVHEFDVLPWVADSPIGTVEVRHGRANRDSPRGMREPILVLFQLASGVLVDVEMNVTAGFGYQVTTEAVFQAGVVRIGGPRGAQVWNGGHARVPVHQDYITRFRDAYDAQVQCWIDGVHQGRLVSGPSAWDGYRVALACEAGLAAMDGSPGMVQAAPRPAFYR
ncbi:MAG: Gfo/Idh/MocA family protein [Beutenbergiaceae bacterium]